MTMGQGPREGKQVVASLAPSLAFLFMHILNKIQYQVWNVVRNNLRVFINKYQRNINQAQRLLIYD